MNDIVWLGKKGENAVLLQWTVMQKLQFGMITKPRRQLV